MEKIISSGHTGVNQAALTAAKLSNIKTGGYSPHKWITEKGNEYEFLKEFNMIEGQHDNYISNISQADGTLIITWGISTVNASCVEIYANDNSENYMIIGVPVEETIQDIKNWISENNIKTLNIEGPYESQIGEYFTNATVNFILKLIKACSPAAFHYHKTSSL